MVYGKEYTEKTRRRELQASFSVEGYSSESGSDGEIGITSLTDTRKPAHSQRTKTSFHRLINQMGSSTRKLEEETSGLLRDLVAATRGQYLEEAKKMHRLPFLLWERHYTMTDSLRSQNLSTGRRLQRLEKVSDAMKGQIEAFTLKQGSKPMTSL